MFIKKMAIGKAKLWHVWWLYWKIPTAILCVLFAVVNIISYKSNILILPLLIFIFIELTAPFFAWKCSSNTKSKGWTSIARICLIIGPILSISHSNQGDINNAFSLRIIVATLIIISWYFVSKKISSSALINFNDKYIYPIYIIILHNYIILVGLTTPFLTNYI